MEKVSGIVESKSRKGNSIKVGGEWYSVYAAKALTHVEWKDTVEFLYEQKGEYRNIKGKVTRLSGPSGSASGSPKSGGGYNNLGVEVGHASNLAMRMMEQLESASCGLDYEIGSTDWFKQFTQFTVDMHQVMKAIRAKVESAEGAAIVPKPTPTAEATHSPPSSEGSSLLDDLFD